MYWIPKSGWFSYPLVEGVVERINGFPVLALGASLFAIHSHVEHVNEFPYAQMLPLLTNAIQSLEAFTTTTVVDLPLSLTAAKGILTMFRNMVTPEQIQQRANSQLSVMEVATIRFSIQHFTSVLFAELPQADTYYINEKRAFKMSKLLSGAEVVLPPEILPFLSPLTKSDIQHAGRCLAYDENTACGFHALRAVEDVARRFYELVTGKSAVTPNTGNPIRLWDIVDGLAGALTSLGNPLKHPLGMIVGDLNRLRVIYRNPIMHPEMTLGANEAIRVFNVSADVIAAMIEDIQKGGAHFNGPRNWLASLAPLASSLSILGS